MSPKKTAITPTEIYDQALKYARDEQVPPGVPQPDFTSSWLPENIAVLERYREWLSGGGTSWAVIRTYHIPVAGHVLSLNHKPSGQLDLDHELGIAMTYILAKQHGVCWNKICRNSLAKFRRFLLHERGRVESKIRPYDPTLHTEGLPAWLVEQLIRYQHIKQRNWREARIVESIRRFWCGYLRMWRFFVGQCGVQGLKDLRRQHLYDCIDFRLQSGHAATGVNSDLRDLRAVIAQRNKMVRLSTIAKNCLNAVLGTRVHDSGLTHRNGRITKTGRKDLRRAMVDAANHAILHHPFWKKVFERLEPRLGRSKAVVAIARTLLVVVWHVLSKDQADRHADARDVACSLFAHAYRVGVKNLPNGLSAKDFTRQQLDRLGLGEKLEVIPWGSKKVKLPPSTLTPQQQKK